MAVSGGSDSLALLHLLADRGVPGLVALTVDHGLRTEAADEARMVARICKALGIAHETLEWRGWDGRGNLQAQARTARYKLLAGFCVANGIGDVALGHTRDDNIETFFIGLTRGAGLDGLSGMRAAFRRDGVTFHRPLLGLTRAALRDDLRGRGVTWAEDPGNDDPRYTRVRIRQMLAGLDIDAGRIAASIGNLAATARDIGAELHMRLTDHSRLDAGDLVLDRDVLAAFSPEFRRRALSTALAFIARGGYRPRGADVMRLVERDWGKGAATLHGCVLSPGRDGLRISREYAAVADLSGASTEIWDNRWRFVGRHRPGMRVRALGPDGLALCSWRQPGGPPRHALLASPSVWLGGDLVAAPMVPGGASASAELSLTPRDDHDHFLGMLLSH